MTTKARSSASEPAGEQVTYTRDDNDRLAELERRIENLERYTGTPAPDEAERERAERDEEILSRTPTSYKEAVEQEAARKRRADRGD